jgi:hypothetical protein
MASDSPPTPTSYDRGFRAGCLLGCSPLIALFILFILFMVGSGGPFGIGDLPTADAPTPLPRIDPSITAAGLLPAPPPSSKPPVYLGDDLLCVPELMLEDARKATPDEWRSRKARAAAVALHLNSKEEDGFLKALLETRPDLAGLPFTLGAACRTSGDRAKAFKKAAEAVRSEKGAALLTGHSGPDSEEDNLQQFYQAHLAVVTQVIHAEDSPNQSSLVRALSSIPSPEATRSLARLAVFATDEATRASAIKALAIRREADSANVFLAGLRYPWPAVAENAASAMAKLKRTDLIPQLRAALATPDPRGPRIETVAGREETVAYELVRVNHLRNCMLCHAPVERGKAPDETLVAEVPVPTMPLPDFSAGYGQSESNLLVRVDVTYLRQDFSAMLKVTDWSAESWPSSQRFDFLVRRRVLNSSEAADLRARLVGPSPYHSATARALRELTGDISQSKASKGMITE